MILRTEISFIKILLDKFIIYIKYFYYIQLYNIKYSHINLLFFTKKKSSIAKYRPTVMLQKKANINYLLYLLVLAKCKAKLVFNQIKYSWKHVIRRTKQNHPSKLTKKQDRSGAELQHCTIQYYLYSR